MGAWFTCKQNLLLTFMFLVFSVSALLMMVTLKKLASTGCTIIFTMYQSSTEVFGLFDRICLLSNGNTLFFGETLACLQVDIFCIPLYLLYLFARTTNPIPAISTGYSPDKPTFIDNLIFIKYIKLIFQNSGVIS